MVGFADPVNLYRKFVKKKEPDPVLCDTEPSGVGDIQVIYKQFKQ